MRLHGRVKMKRDGLAQHAKSYFLPLILGNTPEARRLSAKLFRTFGIKSFLLDKKGSWRNLLSASHYFIALTPSDCSRLICEQLTDCAKQHPATLPILVPMTDEYRAALKENCEELERCFIIREPATLLTEPPLGKLRQTKE